MIAVFTKTISLYKKDFHWLPSSMFIMVRSIRDIRGRVFEGVVFYGDWYNADRSVIDAFEALKKRQPALFNEKEK